MDVKLLVLAGTPPLLAILAELFNPVSEKTLRPQMAEMARGLAARPEPGDRVDVGHGTVVVTAATAEEIYEGRAATIATAGVRMATAAVELSAVIPTWISATAGAVALAVERTEPLYIAIATGLWVAISGVLGAYGFATARLWELGYHATTRLRLSRLPLTRQEYLSRCLVIVNVVVILAAVIAACLDAPAAHNPAATAAAPADVGSRPPSWARKALGKSRQLPCRSSPL